MKHLAKVIAFHPRVTPDDLMSYLAAHVGRLQREAIALQAAGLRYREVVVPQKYASVVDGTTILGRKIIAGDVEDIGVIVTPRN